jgi:hypothetical protein
MAFRGHYSRELMEGRPMSEQSTSGTGRPPIQQRGVYLMADTPLKAHPLALEDGSGDKQLLAETICENLADGEVDNLISELISYRVNDGQDGTNIKCEDCGHIRETTEENPTLVNCESCGSYNLQYVDTGTDRSGTADTVEGEDDDSTL